MSATLLPISFARIQSDPIAAEADLLAIYLGDDMDAVCAIAIAASDPVLLTNAALPLKNRRAAIINWRKKQVREMLQRNPDFQRYYDAATPAHRESICGGEIALAELAAEVSALRQERDARQRNARMESKENLRASLHSALRDCDGTEEGLIVPGFLAILENGEIGLFRRRAACVEWARASGVAFLFGNFERGSYKVHSAPAGD